jgi:predicted ATP-dependent endonuclease of OLD family
MFLKKVSISGYKNFNDNFEISFSEGLNVLVGENGIGKSSIIDAIRLILSEDEYGRSGISEKDFHRSFYEASPPSPKIKIVTYFEGLSEKEKTAFIPWILDENQARLTLLIDNKQNNHGRYIRRMWGGASQSSFFERELLDCIHCIYLPPLRDAEAKLREGKGSRLARLIINLNKKEIAEARKNNDSHPLEEEVNSFYNRVAVDEKGAISKANELIKSSLKEAIGNVFGQDTRIQFSETSFNRIVESLRLFFFPNIDIENQGKIFRSLEENSLGFNNLIYLATVLAELQNITNTEDAGDKDEFFLKLLLIEEPEAHLHPQLQIKLLKYLECESTKSNIQIIVTTHSPILASAVSIDSIIHLSTSSQGKIVPVPLKECGLSDQSKAFLSRWLDVTKSTLFFAKGVILVEGIAEAMVIPELGKRVIKKYNKVNIPQIPDTLEEQGISIININGIYFRHFVQFFCNINPEYPNAVSIPLKCSGITDNDPSPDQRPSILNSVQGKNPALQLIGEIARSENCRLFSNFKTFEYDLAMEEGNLNHMIKTFLQVLTTNGPIREEYTRHSQTDWINASSQDKDDISTKLLKRINDPNIGKGRYAQELADYLSKEPSIFEVPDYISKSVLWVCGVKDV